MTSIQVFAAGKPSSCGGFLTASRIDVITAYLSELLVRGNLSHQALERAVAEPSRFVNPIDERDAAVSVSAGIHRATIHELISDLSLNELSQVHDWIKSRLSHQSRVQEKQQVLNEQQRALYEKPNFVPVRAGEFIAHEFLTSQKKSISHDFEIMDTLVTQDQWIAIMGDNPSQHVHFAPPKTLEKNVMYVDSAEVFYFAGRPVESISAWEAMEFANKLSEAQGYTPAYRLSQEARDRLAFINNKSQDIYATSGYRLPTNDEWEFLFADRGESDRLHRMIKSPQLLDSVAWFASNSNSVPQAVATKAPIQIGESKIYDFFGNSSIWLHIDSRVDPNAGESFGVRGFSFESIKVDHDALRCVVARPNRKLSGVGLRLVRTTYYRDSPAPVKKTTLWFEWLKNYIKF